MLQSQGLRAAAGAGGFIPFVADVLLVGTGGGGDYGGGAGGLVVTYTTQTVQKGDVFRVGIGDNPSARNDLSILTLVRKLFQPRSGCPPSREAAALPRLSREAAVLSREAAVLSGLSREAAALSLRLSQSGS